MSKTTMSTTTTDDTTIPTSPTGRCLMCGAVLVDYDDSTLMFCPPDPRMSDDGWSFCQSRWVHRYDHGWPLPTFRPWDEEVLRREKLRRGEATGVGDGTGVCALPGCDNKLSDPIRQKYCSPSHTTKAYRMRKAGA